VAAPPVIDADARAAMLEYIDKKLTPEQAAPREGPSPGGALTRDELLAALKTSQAGKSAGLDGLPYEFYLSSPTPIPPRSTRPTTKTASAAPPTTTAS
jgi:hypothetical protein